MNSLIRCQLLKCIITPILFFSVMIWAGAATFVWTNTAGGDWNTAPNWSPNQVPGTNDTAMITNAGTYTVSLANFNGNTISNVVLGGISGTQTFTMTYGLNINGQMTVNSNAVFMDHIDSFSSYWGTLAGPGSLTVSGQWTWDGTLDLASITNQGQASLVAGNMNGCFLVNEGSMQMPTYYTFTGGSVLSNAPSGTFLSTSFANYDYSWDPIFQGSASTIVNAGLFIVSYPNISISDDTGFTESPWYGYSELPFINLGTLLLTNSSNFSFDGGGTNLGTINIGPGSTLTCSNAYQFAPGTVTGGGELVNEYSGLNLSGTIGCGTFLSAQPTFVTGALDATNSYFDAATTFTNSGSLQGSINVFASIYCYGNGALNPDVITLFGGIYGTNPVVATGPLIWTNITGNIYDSVTVNGGFINVPFTASITGGGTLVNTGYLNWTPNSGPRTGGGSVISNVLGATISASLNGNSLDNFALGGSAAFYNAGLIAFSTTNANQTGGFTGFFANNGTVDVNNGTVTLSGGGTNSGTLTLATGTTLQVNSPGYTFANGTLIDGNGSINFTGGTANFTGSDSVNVFNWLMTGATVNTVGTGPLDAGAALFSSGTFAGSQPVLASAGFFWSGGTMNGVVECAGGNVTASGVNMYGGQIVNSGQMYWSGNPVYAYDGTIISNTASGTLDLAGATMDNETGGGSLLNAGTVNVISASSTSVPLTNSGTVNVQAGQFTVANGGLTTGSFNVASGAALNLTGGTFTANPGSIIYGSGSLNDYAGTFNSLGALSLFGGNSGIVLNLAGATANFVGSGSVMPSVFNFSGGTMAGSEPVVASGGFNWSGGTMNGVVECDGGNVTASGVNMYGGQIINSGALSWSGNPVYFYSGAVLSNTASGTLDLVGSSMVNETGGGSVLNAGTLDVQAGSYTSVPLTNSGTINVQVGQFNVAGGGVNNNLITVVSGAGLNLSGGTFTEPLGSVFNGAGYLAVNGGTANLNGAVNVSGSWNFGGGTADYAGTSTASGFPVNISGGIVVFGGSGVLNAGLCSFSAGTFGGTEPVVASGGFNWSGGTMNGVVECDGGNVTASGVNMYGGQIINSGVLSWIGNPVYFYSGAMVSNTTSGTLDLAGAAMTDVNPGGTFLNVGTINVQAGSSTSVPLTNSGTINVLVGQFNVSNGGANDNLITVASSAGINLSGGTFTAPLGSVLNGAGYLEVNGGTANLNGAVNVSGSWSFGGGTANYAGTSTANGFPLNISGGNVAFGGSGVLNAGLCSFSSGTFGGSEPVVASGGFNWSGGTMNGVVECAGGNVTASGVNMNGGQIINSGAMSWSGNPVYFYSGAILSNTPSGMLDLVASTMDNQSGGGSFLNAGTLDVQSGSYTSVPLTNSGTINVQVGQFNVAGGGANTNLITVTSGADLNLSGGTYMALPASVISGAGNLTVSGGTANLNGAVNVTGSWNFGGGTASYTGTTTASDFPLYIYGGNVSFGASAALDVGVCSFSSGTMAGSEPVVASGGFNWSGGTMNGVVECAGGIVTASGVNMYGGQVINRGVMSWSGNTVYFYSGAVLSNTASGTLDLVGSSMVNETGGGSVLNAGTLDVLAGSYSSVPMTNSGTINLESGNLNASGGLRLNSGTLGFSISGPFNYATLTAAGNLALTNTSLQVGLDGYTPRVGDSFNLISYGSESGPFTSLALPASATWQSTYGSTEFNLAITGLVSVATSPVELKISLSGTNLLLQWTNAVAGYALQSSTNLAVTGNWNSLVTNPPVVNGQYTFTNPTPKTPIFFRLNSN